jgi:hypothetical protein
LARARTSAPVRVGLAFGLGGFAALWFGFQVFLHYSFEGYAYAPFLFSEWMPLPGEERAAGYAPVCFGDQAGWDGMYYFVESNDPFLLRDNPRIGFDNASYRYQRIGMPLVAHAASRLIGRRMTPPLLYHLIQFAFATLGLGTLAGFLVSRGISPWYSLGWLASGGVVHALYHGLADAPGDALFAMACVAILTRRLGLYAATATLLCLCREGYVAFCGPVFLLTACGWLNWGDAVSIGKRLAFSALPGVVVLGWAVYVAARLHEPILNGSRRMAWGWLVDWPFFGPVKQLRKFWWAGEQDEFRYALVSIFTLSIVLAAAVRRLRGNAWVWAAIPIVVLAAMTGGVVWLHHSGHMKNIGYVLVFAVLLLPIERGAWLRLLLGVNLLAGVDVTLNDKLFHPVLYSPNWAGYTATPQLRSGPAMGPVTDYRSLIELAEDPVPSKSGDGGFWKWCHRSIRHYSVVVTNRGTEAWLANPATGPRSLSLTVRLFDDRHRVRWWYRYPLPEDVRPGGSVSMKFGVPMPPGGGGIMALLVSVTQGDADFFEDHEPGAGYGEVIGKNGPRQAAAAK